MGIDDFTKKWKVRDDPAPVGETAGDKITIAKTNNPQNPNEVSITCDNNHTYSNGTYQSNPEQINVGSDRITLSKGSKNVITYGSSGLPTGSWTADDNIGGEG